MSSVLTHIQQINIRGRYLKFTRNSEPYLFVGPAMFLLIILLLVPIFKVIIDSFYDNSFISANAPFIGLENYLAIFKKPILIKVISNSLIFTIASVALHLVIGMGLAVGLNQSINRVALAVFRAIFILPWIFTAAVVALAWKLILTPLGVLNFIIGIFAQTKVTIEWLGNPALVLLTLILINAWRGYPFVMVSILAGLQSIDQEMYEAASIDGAGALGQFRYVTLPQLKPILLSVGLLDGIWTLNLFPLIWLTTGGGPNGATETIATITYKLAFNQFEFGQASAMAVLAIIFTLVITVYYLKYQKMD